MTTDKGLDQFKLWLLDAIADAEADYLLARRSYQDSALCAGLKAKLDTLFRVESAMVDAGLIIGCQNKSE